LIYWLVKCSLTILCQINVLSPITYNKDSSWEIGCWLILLLRKHHRVYLPKL
jgi:hypothetical protein